jgi:hypothetical protein
MGGQRCSGGRAVSTASIVEAATPPQDSEARDCTELHHVSLLPARPRGAGLRDAAAAVLRGLAGDDDAGAASRSLQLYHG